MEPMDIVPCHRLGETSRVIAELLNRKDAQNVLKASISLEVSISMMITLIPTIKEKSSLIKAFVRTIGNFMVW